MSSFVIGLTGGVASGKSAAANAFAELGVAIADADVAAREAVAIGSDGLAEVVDAFGSDLLMPSGELDRGAMRRRVFADANARRLLEAIVHPRVRAALHVACAQAPGPYAIAAIPLLAEGGGREAYPWLQRILVIDVPEDVQRMRLQQRDGIDVALADRMLAAQATRAQRLLIADDIVHNTGTLESMRQRVRELHRAYLTLARAAAWPPDAFIA